MSANIYDFSVKNSAQQSVSLRQYTDKVVMVVNTASQCGLTPQFTELEALFQMYRERGLVILGFPSDQFRHQEPLNDGQIQQFCQVNYGVSFPVFAKIDVKGKQADPLFRFLSSRQQNGAVGLAPLWNFQKYLINRQGEVVDYFLPTTSPTAGRVKRAIEDLL